MMRGKMRERIAIQAAAHTDDSNAGQLDAWTTIATVYAEVLPTGGDKSLEGGVVVMGQQGWKVRFRYRPGLDITNRFLWGDKPLAIRSIADPDGSKFDLLAFCESGVPT